MEFKQAIRDYQNNGDRTIIKRILEYVELDLQNENWSYDHDKGKIVYHYEQPEKYIAYRIKSMREMLARHAKSLRSGNIEEWREYVALFEEYQDMGIFGVSDPNDCQGIWDQIEDFKDYFRRKMDDVFRPARKGKKYKQKVDALIEKEVDYQEFIELLQHFTDLNNEVEEEKQRIRDELVKYIIPALEYSLDRVDCSYSEKEMVKYINRLWLTKFIEVQCEDKGLIRLQRKENGKVVSKYTRPTFRSIEVMVFGESLVKFGGKENMENFLTVNQWNFINDVYSIVAKEVNEKNFDNFRFDSAGYAILNKRYIAEQLGIDESALKHRLRRIDEKIKRAKRHIANERLRKSLPEGHWLLKEIG